MTQLKKSLDAWNTPEFASILKDEMEQLDAGTLPLQQGLSRSSYVSEDSFTVMIIKVSEEQLRIRVMTGIFYTGIVAGCNCADDPTPVEGQMEHCEVEVEIDKATAEATFTLR